MKRTNFENVKVGDKIIYRTDGTWNSRVLLSSVVKVTPKQFVDEVGAKFRKSDGAVIGESMRFARYATEDDVREANENQKRRHINYKIKLFTESYEKLKNVSLEDLEAIYEIIKKYEDK